MSMGDGVDGLQVVAEPRRRDILQLVWSRELAASAIAAHFDVSFPAVSQHLGVLRDAGFVSVRREGRTRLYSADRKALGPLRPLLEKMWNDKLDRLAGLIEKEAR
jgi:DNA-binding transcriptional ArsR family regulator